MITGIVLGCYAVAWLFTMRLSRLECDLAIAAFTAAKDTLPEDTGGGPS
jgi:hypothetical protein